MGLIPGSGIFPWIRKWQHTPVFFPVSRINNSYNSTIKRQSGTSLVIQWLRLLTPNVGGPDLIPGQETGWNHLHSCFIFSVFELLTLKSQFSMRYSLDPHAEQSHGSWAVWTSQPSTIETMEGDSPFWPFAPPEYHWSSLILLIALSLGDTLKATPMPQPGLRMKE